MRALNISLILSITVLCSLTVIQAARLDTKKLFGYSSAQAIVQGGPIKGENFGGIWEKRCARNGGPRAYDAYTEVQQVTLTCFRSVVNKTQLIIDLLKARRTGEFVPLFKNYCLKAPIIHVLEDYLTESIRTCLDPVEEPSLDTYQDLGRSLVNYICHDEGYRLATFAESGGVDCMLSNKRSFGNCFGRYIASYIGAFGIKALDKHETLPVLGAEFRKNFEKFRICTIKFFTECGNETSTNLWNSMIIHLRNKIPFH